LIERAIHTLRHTLIEEITVVGLVCILFLLHARSELVAVFVVPASVLVALLLMHVIGINANIMSLGGIAIAIGVVVDSAIVMVEASLWVVADVVEVLRPWQWWMAIGWAVLAGMLLIPQKIIHEKHSPISWVLQKMYNPFFKMAMSPAGMVVALLVAAAALAS